MRIGYKELFDRLWQKMSDDDIIGNAAKVAFYFTFALFPLLLFLMTLFGLILNDKQDLQAQLFDMLSRVMPTSAYELVRQTLDEVTSRASGGKLTLGVLVTIWSASAGIDNMRSTLNEVYNLEETRSWWKAKLVSILLTLGLGILILLSLGFLVYGSEAIGYVVPIDIPVLLEVFQWIVVLCLVLLAFALIYNFAPNHAPFRWKWVTPGAVVGVIMWIVLSLAFQLYLSYFNTYAATYGSLGAVIILLLWLYLTAFVILVGGAINAILDESSGVKKETHDPEQEMDEKAGTGKKQKT